MRNDGATIVTFYSYKGGVGRSMAVANIAWVLAEKFHKRVLAVDWDLEAPGLHRFFDVADADLSRGLIEIFNDYKALLREEQKSLPEQLVEVRRYIHPAKLFHGGGQISILPAGKQDKNYATLINEFSWTDFYAKWHGFGFIEYLKNELKKLPEIDIVIVDSRTGVTDIGGICTLQLPDIVVLLFALNDQNIRGVKLVAERISQKAVEIEGRDRPPALIIRPARVERTGNQEAKIKWQDVAASVLGEFVTEGDPRVLMAKRNIPYIGDYSYGETPLAVAKDPLGDMAEAFEDLAQAILQTARREDESPRGRSFLTPMGYFSRGVQKFLWNAKNVAILILSLVLAVSIVGFALEHRRVKSLSADVDAKTKAVAALTEENRKDLEELERSRSAPAAATQQLDFPTSSEPQPRMTPADWRTTKPNAAWCFQSYEPRPGLQYKAVCHWSQFRCETAKKQMRSPTAAASECKFVEGLNNTGWQPQHGGWMDSWFQYLDQPLGSPFPQLPPK